jgi:hypothetical protein
MMNTSETRKVEQPDQFTTNQKKMQVLLGKTFVFLPETKKGAGETALFGTWVFLPKIYPLAPVCRGVHTPSFFAFCIIMYFEFHSC